MSTKLGYNQLLFDQINGKKYSSHSSLVKEKDTKVSQVPNEEDVMLAFNLESLQKFSGRENFPLLETYLALQNHHGSHFYIKSGFAKAINAFASQDYEMVVVTTQLRITRLLMCLNANFNSKAKNNYGGNWEALQDKLPRTLESSISRGIIIPSSSELLQRYAIDSLAYNANSAQTGIFLKSNKLWRDTILHANMTHFSRELAIDTLMSLAFLLLLEENS